MKSKLKQKTNTTVVIKENGPSLGSPPRYVPIASENVNFANPAVDYTVLSNEERRILTGHFPIGILYLKEFPVTRQPHNLYLFVEEDNAHGKKTWRLIPYEGTTQNNNGNLIYEYTNHHGISTQRAVSDSMYWRFGRFSYGQSGNEGQKAEIIIRGITPFTRKFKFVEATYSPNPPHRMNISEIIFDRPMIPNRPFPDMGIRFSQMRRLQERSLPAGFITADKSEASKTITLGTGFDLIALGFFGLAAYSAYCNCRKNNK